MRNSNSRWGKKMLAKSRVEHELLLHSSVCCKYQVISTNKLKLPAADIRTSMIFLTKGDCEGKSSIFWQKSKPVVCGRYDCTDMLQLCLAQGRCREDMNMARNNSNKPILAKKEIENQEMGKLHSPDKELAWLNGEIRAAEASGGEKSAA